MRFLISFILFFNSLTVFSQHDKVMEIRKLYLDTREKIQQMNTDSASPGFYADIHVKNMSGAQWRAIGIYADTLKLYYTDLLDASLAQGDSANALVMVCQNSVYSNTRVYREWLFDKGNLVFYFESHILDNEKNEYRFYFNDRELIRYMQGGQVISYDDDTKPMLEEAEGLKRWFINSFIRSL